MKAFTTYMVIFVLIFLTACTQTAGLANQQSSKTEASSTKSPYLKEQSTPPAEPTRVFSNSPLSTGILISRYDTVKNKIELFAVDSENGLPIASAKPIPVGGSFFSIRSPDGKTQAAVIYSNVNSSNGRVNSLDLASWQLTSLDIEVDGWVGMLAYSPDERYLLIVTWIDGSNIYLIDTQTNKLANQKFLEDRFVKAHFSGDSSRLLLYTNQWDTTSESKISPSAVSMSVPGLQIEWAQSLDGVKHGYFVLDTTKDLHDPEAGLNYEPGIAFSPVGDRLFIVHADEERLTTVDFNKQKVTSVNISPRLSWLERLLWMDARPAKAKFQNGTIISAAVSPDGKFVYVTGVTHTATVADNGDWMYDSKPAGFRVIDSKSGTELAKHETNAASLRLSPDGRVFLYAMEGPYQSGTQVFDPASGKMEATFQKAVLEPIYRIDGKLAYVSEIYLENGGQILSLYDSRMKEILSFRPGKGFYENWIVDP